MQTTTISGYDSPVAMCTSTATTNRPTRCRRKSGSVPQERMKTVSPELQALIDEARKEYEAGHYVVCSTKEDLDRLFDSML